MASKHLIFLCLLGLTNITLAVDCVDHAWFSMIPVPYEVAETLLPDGFCLEKNHPLRSIIPEGTHPLLFEFGDQSGCHEPGIPFFKTSFIEMKLEVPFVNDGSDSFGPNVLKPYIYSSTFFDAWSSYLTFGLPTYHATMKMTDTSYYVEYKGMKIEAQFNTASEYTSKWGSIDDFPNFQNYVKAVATPWFCKNIFFDSIRCATNSYTWDTMKIRPAEMSVKLTGEIFGKGLKDQAFEAKSIVDSPYGTAEIEVPLSLTFP
eukprot:CAMPEP_0115014034 /NCGR_PEP_ID=MMETSP0216-20121206/25800_1 /TAXON_ID=223996 /ORGANISM="Protocruzia adherens, Strain Boccale" /LENGTH=259 /DNA_ID=CAMNT_0002383621 /DNA_START=27 /DNA_END=802 /DNA_ORIENTATION=-